MRRKRFGVILLLSAMLMTACMGQREPSETTLESADPSVTTALQEIETSARETTVPQQYTIPSDVTLSFFTYEVSPVLRYYNFYIAPAGTEDWYPVMILSYYEYCWHTRTAESNPEDTVTLRRAFVAYDGPPVEKWILRGEYSCTEEAFDMHGDWSDCPLQWETEFELINNETILYLDHMPGYEHQAGAVFGDGLIPMTKEMEFCENCPESWRIPIE